MNTFQLYFLPESFWSRLTWSLSNASGSVTLNFLSRATNFCLRFLCLAFVACREEGFLNRRWWWWTTWWWWWPPLPPPTIPLPAAPPSDVPMPMSSGSSNGSESEPSSGLEKSSSSSEYMRSRSPPSDWLTWKLHLNCNSKLCELKKAKLS